MCHRQVPKRLRRARLDDKSALRNLWHDFFEDVQFQWIELVISKVERVHLGVYCRESRPWIVGRGRAERVENVVGVYRSGLTPCFCDEPIRCWPVWHLDLKTRYAIEHHAHQRESVQPALRR